MTARRLTSFVTILAFLAATSSPALASGGARPAPQTAHALSAVQLHKSAQTFSDQAIAARQYVRKFLSREDVRSQMNFVGLSADTVIAQVARLNDAEIARIHEQVMALDEQVVPAAGLSTGAIVMIVVAGVLAIGAIILVIATAGDDSGYHYYFY